MANLVSMSFVPIIALGISWPVAVVPDSWLERTLPFPTARFAAMEVMFQDWWRDGECPGGWRSPGRGTFRRYIHLPGKSIMSDWRTTFVGTELQGSPEQVEVRNLADELDLSDRSLRYAWLERNRFQNTSFAESVLHCSNFRKATLRGAVFDGARLSETTFDDADLQGALFDGAQVNETTFHEADLQCAVFDEAQLNESTFDDANLRGARFEDVRSIGSEFDRADMRDVALSDSSFSGGSFRSARMEGVVVSRVDLSGTNLGRARLHGADMRRADFFGGSLHRAEFHGADLDGIEFHGTTLREAEFYGAILDGANVRAANANGADFYGSSLVRADVTESSLFEARFFGNDMRSIDLQYSNLQGVRWGRPRNWETVTKEIGGGLKRRGLDAEERDEIFDDIVKYATYGFGSRGVEYMEQMKCTWTDRNGPFLGWDDPEPGCWTELEDNLAGEACNSGIEGVAAGIAAGVAFPGTWQQAASALRLIETGTDECDAITEKHRNEICEGLSEWFDADYQKSGRSEVERLVVSNTLTSR